MENTYFVSFRLLNVDNRGWAYKIEMKTTSYTEAVKKYGELIKTYFETAPFIFGCIKVEDAYGVETDKKIWGQPILPPEKPEEPEATETTEVTE